MTAFYHEKSGMRTVIRHGTGNPRNSEGAFLPVEDGRIRFIYTRYSGDSRNDHAAADLAEVISDDGGETWKDNGIVISRGDADNIMSVSLLRLRNGACRIAYLEKRKTPSGMVCIPLMRNSDDQGNTWGLARRLIPHDGYYVTANDRAVQLSSGRIILPVSVHLHRTNGCFRPGMVMTLLSDDDGATWSESETMLTPDFQANSTVGFEEPGVVELEPGKLRIWFRTARGFQYRSDSNDNGSTWSPAVPDLNFHSPRSPMAIKKDPATGFLYAVWNDSERRSPLYPAHSERNPLVLMRSRDNGISWDKAGTVLLENEPERGFCYFAMLFSGDSLLLAYNCGLDGNGRCEMEDLGIRKVTLTNLRQD